MTDSAESTTANETAPKRRTEGPKSKVLDAALILSLASAGLYALGFTYWRQFFGYFGIAADFIDVDVTRILATTWPLVVLLIPLFPDGFLVELMDADSSESIVIPGYVVPTWVAALIAYVAMLAADMTLGWSILMFLSVMSVALVVTIALRRYLRAPLRIGAFLHASRAARVLVLSFAFLLFMLTYAVVGGVHGARVAEGAGGSRITLVLDSEPQPPAQLILIAHMKETYFLCVPTPSGQRPQILVVPDSRVLRATLDRPVK